MAKRKADALVAGGGSSATDPKKAKVAHDPPRNVSLPPLKRIIISALEHSTAQGTFSYRGKGLLKDSIPLDNNVSGSLPLLTPVLTKAGKVAKRQPVPTSKPLDWWKAQCVFRGLSQTGKLSALQERVRPMQNASMTEELRVLEKNLDKDFRIKNAEAYDNMWKGLESDQNRAEEDLERFLEERFLGTQSAATAVALRSTGDGSETPSYLGISHYTISHSAESLGLACEFVKTRRPDERQPYREEGWTVVGPTRAEVSAKIKELRDESQRSLVIAQAAKDEHSTQRIAQLVIGEVGDPGTEWDVSGTWIVDCPYVQEQWGDQGKDECQLVITFEPASEGLRMWASFNFLVHTGVFRFGKLGEVLAVESLEDDSEVCEDEEGLGGYLSDTYEGPSKKSKPLTEVDTTREYPKVRPSSNNRKWDFQWRGSDTGEDQLQMDFECQNGHISFGGPNGTKLLGLYDSSLTGQIEFTGRKSNASTVTTAKTMARQWAKSDRMEWERQCAARWHSGCSRDRSIDLI